MTFNPSNMNGNSNSNFVTIVSGLPRSGTSMMMRMLESGGMPVLTDEVRGEDEDNPNGYYEFEPVKKLKHDTSWLASAENKAVKMVYMLLYDLPPNFQYRVIFMRRKIEEVLASQKTMLTRQGKTFGGLSDATMAEAFAVHLDKLRSWVSQQENMKVLYVNYNDMMRDAAPVTEEIRSFLDHRVSSSDMAKVVDRSLYRQRVE